MLSRFWATASSGMTVLSCKGTAMKRLIPLILLLLLLGGCSSGEGYLSVRPHVEQYNPGPAPTETEPVPVVSNRLELRGAILSLIDNWKEQGTVLIRNYEGDVTQNLNEVMDYATRQHPTGAYAVDYADAEIREENGQQLVQVSFVFRRSLSEINSIVLVDNNDAAYTKIEEALNNYSTALTLRIRRYSDRDFASEIIRYCLENPRKVPAIPEFSLKLYPEKGDHRILELHFTYPESKDVMREKLLEVETTFQSALSYGSAGKTPLDKATRLCQYLIRRRNQSLSDAAPTLPLYSLLSENTGHDLSFAMCYNDLCTSLGIHSRIVQGSKNGAPYYWNLLEFEEEVFHVDLRRYVEQKSSTIVPLYDEELLAEGYSWDQSSYPAAPLKSTEPSESTGPSESTNPSETTVPSESTGPSESTEPSETTEPREPGTTEAPTVLPEALPEETDPPAESEPTTNTEPSAETEPPTETESLSPSDPPPP